MRLSSYSISQLRFSVTVSGLKFRFYKPHFINIQLIHTQLMKTQITIPIGRVGNVASPHSTLLKSVMPMHAYNRCIVAQQD